jgi:hypothetical protein
MGPVLDLIRHRVIIETQAEHLFTCLKAGTVSTNVHLRKQPNFCLSMNWLPWPLIPKRLWPEVEFQPKRAITIEEHLAVIHFGPDIEAILIKRSFRFASVVGSGIICPKAHEKSQKKGQLAHPSRHIGTSRWQQDFGW